MSSNTILDSQATRVSSDRSNNNGNASRPASGAWLMRQEAGPAASPILRLCAVVSEVARNRRQS